MSPWLASYWLLLWQSSGPWLPQLSYRISWAKEMGIGNAQLIKRSLGYHCHNHIKALCSILALLSSFDLTTFLPVASMCLFWLVVLLLWCRTRIKVHSLHSQSSAIGSFLLVTCEQTCLEGGNKRNTVIAKLNEIKKFEKTLSWSCGRVIFLLKKGGVESLGK